MMIEYAQRYAMQRGLAESTQDTYAAHARGLARFLGHDDLGQISTESVSAYLAKLKKDGGRDSYRKSARAHLVAMLKAAAADSSLKCRPDWSGNVATVSVRDYQPQALTIEELRQLVAATEKMTGRYRGHRIHRAKWWNAYIRLAWDSGLAPCDVVLVTRRSLSLERATRTIRSKTGKRVWFHVRESTLAAIDATFPPRRPECLPLWGSWEMFRREFKRLANYADIPEATAKWIRAGSGCDVEKQAPGTGHQHLANSRAVFEQAYYVPEICGESLPTPTPID